MPRTVFNTRVASPSRTLSSLDGSLARRICFLIVYAPYLATLGHQYELS
jgi:hypothetical protein